MDMNIEVEMALEKNPDVKVTLVYFPKKVGKRISARQFNIADLANKSVILATVIRTKTGIELALKQPEIFGKKDAQNAMLLIGDAIATRISMASGQQTKH